MLFGWSSFPPPVPRKPVVTPLAYVCLSRRCSSDHSAQRGAMCVFPCVWRVTPGISCALEKVTLVESSLHLGLPCPWILWVFCAGRDGRAGWYSLHLSDSWPTGFNSSSSHAHGALLWASWLHLSWAKVVSKSCAYLHMHSRIMASSKSFSKARTIWGDRSPNSVVDIGGI